MSSPAMVFRAADLSGLGTSILTALGAPPESAATVAEHVVTAHLMGLESHGIIRIAQYTRDIRNGRIRPTAVPQVVRSGPSMAVIDGGAGFGQLTAMAATDQAIDKARANGVAVVGVRRCNHVGRLGAYVELAARTGMIAIAVAAIPKVGHFVAPWGGMDGRLGTNPMAYGFPTSGDPIVADFATSVIPEGRVRTAKNKGVSLPEGAVLDAGGLPTRDAAAFYGPPMGTLLPFGGFVGHKGYALALLVELLGATLVGDQPADEDRSINGFTMIALAPSVLGGSEDVRATADAVVGYMRSSRPAPGTTEVMVPGQPEFAALLASAPSPHISLDPETWRQVEEIDTRSLCRPLPPSEPEERRR